MLRIFKFSILAIIDFLLCALSITLAYWVRYENFGIVKQIDYLKKSRKKYRKGTIPKMPVSAKISRKSLCVKKGTT